MLSIYAAFLLDCIAGDPYWFPHPVRIIGFYISRFESFARKITGSDKGLFIMGLLLAFSAPILSYAAVYAILGAAAHAGRFAYYVVNMIILYTCLAPKCLSKEALIIQRALQQGDIAKSRKLLSFIVGRDTENLDERGIAKAVVETVAENTSDGVIAPLFYMVLGGAPLAMAYKAINTLDSMVGYKNDRYMNFGKASALMDDAANYIPARLTGLFMVVAAWILGFDYKGSFRILRRDCRKHSSPNSGYPEAAAAGALGIQLGGNNSYFGKLVSKPTIGDDGRVIGSDDIYASVKLMYGASVLALLVFTAGYCIGRSFV